MPINAFPIATVPPAANLISNTPAGSVTATDVQAAINQLASLIPIVGSGTDPLFLVNGLSINTNNPTVSGDPNASWAQRIVLNTDCSNVNPTFSNNESLDIQLRATHGQATNGLTQAKITFLPLNVGAIYNASGQKFLNNWNIQSFGMSDTAIGQQFVQYAGGPVNGDEGQGFQLVSVLQQQGFLNITTINTKPPQNTINTTVTNGGGPGGSIVASKNAQTIVVGSTAGLFGPGTGTPDPGNWVVIQQQLPNAQPDIEAVFVTGFGPTSITGVFRCNHPVGVTVTPALRIFCDSTYQMGQDRFLVNLSSIQTVSAGTVSGVSGGGLIGTGTAWSNTMVGGNDVAGNRNIGAIALAIDDYAGAPFNDVTPLSTQGPLKHWYQIGVIADATHLGIYSNSCAGDGSYVGPGQTPANMPSNYIIRPCAKVLRIMSVPGNAGIVTGELICETTTSTWNVGDKVEEAICPYADVTAFSWHTGHYTRGGAGVRAFFDIRNLGPRTMSAGINFIDQANRLTEPGWDSLAFGTILQMQSVCNVGLSIRAAQHAAIQLYSSSAGNPSDTDLGGRIKWGPGDGEGGFYYSTLEAGIAIDGHGPGVAAGKLRFIQPNHTYNIAPVTGQSMLLFWGGLALGNHALGGTVPPTLTLYKQGPNLSGTDYARAFMRFSPIPIDEFRLGTEATGTANPQNLILVCNGVDKLTFDLNGNVAVGPGPLAANANNGFFYIPTCAGPPTGAPTTFTGRVPMIYDTTNNKFYIYNGTWKGGTTPGAFT